MVFSAIPGEKARQASYSAQKKALQQIEDVQKREAQAESLQSHMGISESLISKHYVTAAVCTVLGIVFAFGARGYIKILTAGAARRRMSSS
jgi:hypothetical protein